MVKIIEDYYLDADTNCYSLKQYSGVDKEGNDLYNTLGYYSDIETALKGLLKDKTRNYIRVSEKANISNLIDTIKEQNKIIESLNIKI